MDEQTAMLSNKNQMLRDSNLDEFLESSKFFSDQFINTLIEKSIKLGFPWETVKETFMRYFQAANIDPVINENLNYSMIIDEEKFIEQLILLSIQLENTRNSAKNAQLNSNYDEDEFDEQEDYSNLTNEEAESEMRFNGDLDQNDSYTTKQIVDNIQLKQIMPPILNSVKSNGVNATKKPMSMQQKLYMEHQEFVTKSMNRLNDKSNLRPIIIDSNDVAISSHSNKQVFLFSRIKQVVDYFEKRNHQIYVLLPSWRKEQIMAAGTQQPTGMISSISNQQQSDQLALLEMERKNQVHYTPSKRVGSKRIVCDDDCYMLKLAVANKGIIVSNDNFKRFLNYNEDFKQVIEERVLMYTFIDETFMPAEDPLGKSGPSLDNFLRFESFVNQQFMKRCPYRKKCTYGSKCKFWHPERGMNQGPQSFKTAHQSVLDEAQIQKIKLDSLIKKNQPLLMNMDKNTKSSNMGQEVNLNENSEPFINKTNVNLNQPTINLTQKHNFLLSKTFAEQQVNENNFLRSMGISQQSQMNESNIYLRNQQPQINNSNKVLHDLSMFNQKTQSPIINPKLINVQKWHSGDLDNQNNAYTSSIWESLKLSGNDVTEDSQNSKDSSLISNLMGGKFSFVSNDEFFLNHSTKLDASKSNDFEPNTDRKSPGTRLENHQTQNSNLTNENLNDSLKTRLACHLSPEQVDTVLRKYKDETDIDRLIFLAEGLTLPDF